MGKIFAKINRSFLREYNNQTEELQLSFSVCKSEEFNCKDGGCVPMHERCNSVQNCEDNSDEEHCRLIEIDQFYQKGQQPPPKRGQNKTEVSSSNLTAIESLIIFFCRLRWISTFYNFWKLSRKITSSGSNFDSIFIGNFCLRA